ncbi:MAG: hypothetical protein QM484_03635 [Woeseiaceae bacterium]
MTSTATAVTTPNNIDQLISIIQSEFPNSSIRITGRARTIRRQAELMAQRIIANRVDFLQTYTWRQHIGEMNQFIINNPRATLDQTTVRFEAIINTARLRGAQVSNHLSDTARDISIPIGLPATQNTIETRIEALGATVIREPNAAGGPHWHVDW